MSRGLCVCVCAYVCVRVCVHACENTVVCTYDGSILVIGREMFVKRGRTPCMLVHFWYSPCMDAMKGQMPQSK
jgi:hypothetical protein